MAETVVRRRELSTCRLFCSSRSVMGRCLTALRMLFCSGVIKLLLHLRRCAVRRSPSHAGPRPATFPQKTARRGADLTFNALGGPFLFCDCCLPCLQAGAEHADDQRDNEEHNAKDSGPFGEFCVDAALTAGRHMGIFAHDGRRQALALLLLPE